MTDGKRKESRAERIARVTESYIKTGSVAKTALEQNTSMLYVREVLVRLAGKREPKPDFVRWGVQTIRGHYGFGIKKVPDSNDRWVYFENDLVGRVSSDHELQTLIDNFKLPEGWRDKKKDYIDLVASVLSEFKRQERLEKLDKESLAESAYPPE